MTSQLAGAFQLFQNMTTVKKGSSIRHEYSTEYFTVDNADLYCIKAIF